MFLCETSSQIIFFTSIYIHSYKKKGKLIINPIELKKTYRLLLSYLIWSGCIKHVRPANI